MYKALFIYVIQRTSDGFSNNFNVAKCISYDDDDGVIGNCSFLSANVPQLKVSAAYTRIMLSICCG